MTVLQAHGIAKRFGGVPAVAGMDLAVAAGELLGLFGPNGAGKTTLFNVIAGAIRPDAGRVLLDGRDLTGAPAWRRARLGIARSFQIVRPFRALSVVENLLVGVPARGGAVTAEAALAALRTVGLERRAGDPAAALTLGMLKRLEVARALVLAPRLLLLDEPLAGLDGQEAAEVLDTVAGLRGRMAIVMVEHNVRLALGACDRAVVMDGGAKLAEGTPAEIRRDPAVIRAYLGAEVG